MSESLLLTGEKVEVLTASGPSADTTVGTGAAANVDLTISLGKVKKILDHLAVTQISGLPDGVVLAGYSFPSETTLRLRVYNPTGADISVTAGSVSAEVLAKAL